MQWDASDKNILSILSPFEYLGSGKFHHTQGVSFQSHITRAINLYVSGK